ncbi:MAG: hypothetical protein ACK52I_05715 [Pseudomonadota bacterium]
MKHKLEKEIRRIKRQLLIFGHNTEDIDQEMKEIRQALPVLRKNSGQLPEGELLTLTQERIAALEQRLAALEKRAPNYSLERQEQMRKAMAGLEELAAHLQSQIDANNKAAIEAARKFNEARQEGGK